MKVKPVDEVWNLVASFWVTKIASADQTMNPAMIAKIKSAKAMKKDGPITLAYGSLYEP
jgi:hypothetical protein